MGRNTFSNISLNRQAAGGRGRGAWQVRCCEELLGQRSAGGVGSGQNSREAANVKWHRVRETRRGRIVLLLFEGPLEEHKSEVFAHTVREEGT